MQDHPCKCCGIPLDVQRIEWGTCPVCDQCDRLHGDQLERAVRHLLEHKSIEFGAALIRMSVDDAQLCGRIEFRGPRNAAEIWIPNPPRRWEVVVGRAAARREMPAIADIVNACLSPFIPGPSTQANLQAIADELTTALCAIDSNVVSVDVGTEIDHLDPHHLKIVVNTRTNVAPGAVVFGADVEAMIPSDIARRKPAQA